MLKKNTRKIAFLGMGIALYVVFSYFIKIPLINQIRTDFGYLVFGFFLNVFGWPASIVGIAGCIISNLLYSGTFPLGWALGQLVIGITCGLFFMRSEKLWLKCVVGALAVLLGIGVVKTLVESFLFHLPLALKAVRGLVASVADAIPFIAGIILSDRTNYFRDHA